MSIEPISAVNSGTTTVIGLLPLDRPEPVAVTDPAERRLAARQEYDLSVLTPGDLDFLSAVFGPRVITIEDLSQAQNLAQDRAEEVAQVNQFLVDLIRDRQSGALAPGTELTATYVEARFERYAQVNEQNLANARAYFNDRVQGAMVDLLA